MQRSIFEFMEDSGKDYLHLARTKYRDDEGVRTWLRIYEEGTRGIQVRKGKRKEHIGGIPPHSEFALRGLRKAIELREKGRVMRLSHR